MLFRSLVDGLADRRVDGLERGLVDGLLGPSMRREVRRRNVWLWQSVWPLLEAIHDGRPIGARHRWVMGRITLLLG